MVKRALLIGINYKGTNQQLYGCIDDVINIKKVLIEHYGFTESDITMMTDDSAPHNKPTKVNMNKAINDLVVSGAGELYFHYSGHGSRLSGPSRFNNNITTLTGDNGQSTALVPLDWQRAGFISDKDLYTNLVSKVKGNQKLWCVFDCCNSGTGLNLRWVLTPNGLVKGGNYAPSLGPVVLLSASKDNQTASEVAGKGALTTALIAVLAQHNYQITCDRLLPAVVSYIRDNKISVQECIMTFGNYQGVDYPWL